jgi:hypothetical protein
LYSYPKILVPAITLLLFDRYRRAPSTRRLIDIGIWVAVGALFRHDLGIISGLAVLTGLVLTHYGDRVSQTLRPRLCVDDPAGAPALWHLRREH